MAPLVAYTGEPEQATARWPDLLESLPADHQEYSRRIEGHLKALARALPGQRVRLSPCCGLVPPAPAASG